MARQPFSSPIGNWRTTVEELRVSYSERFAAIDSLSAGKFRKWKGTEWETLTPDQPMPTMTPFQQYQFIRTMQRFIVSSITLKAYVPPVIGDAILVGGSYVPPAFSITSAAVGSGLSDKEYFFKEVVGGDLWRSSSDYGFRRSKNGTAFVDTTGDALQAKDYLSGNIGGNTTWIFDDLIACFNKLIFINNPGHLSLSRNRYSLGSGVATGDLAGAVEEFYADYHLDDRSGPDSQVSVTWANWLVNEGKEETSNKYFARLRFGCKVNYKLTMYKSPLRWAAGFVSHSRAQLSPSMGRGWFSAHGMPDVWGLTLPENQFRPVFWVTNPTPETDYSRSYVPDLYDLEFVDPQWPRDAAGGYLAYEAAGIGFITGFKGGRASCAELMLSFGPTEAAIPTPPETGDWPHSVQPPPPCTCDLAVDCQCDLATDCSCDGTVECNCDGEADCTCDLEFDCVCDLTGDACPNDGSCAITGDCRCDGVGDDCPTDCTSSDCTCDIRSDCTCDIASDCPLCDIRSDCHCDVRSDCTCDITSECTCDITSECSCDIANDNSCPCDIRSDCHCDVLSDCHCDIANDCDCPCDIRSDCSCDIRSDCTCDLTNECTCDIHNDCTCDLTSECTCDLTSECTCDITSDCTCDIANDCTTDCSTDTT